MAQPRLGFETVRPAELENGKLLACISMTMLQWFGHCVRKYEAIREEKTLLGVRSDVNALSH